MHYPYSTRVSTAGDVKTEANHSCHSAIDLKHRSVHLRKGDQVPVRDAPIADGAGNFWSPVELSYPEQFIHGWFLHNRLEKPVADEAAT